MAHIYIIDDDTSFGRSLKRLLNVKGISAMHFPSAQSFLDAIVGERSNGIAIIDMNMPECDGFSLMDKMREMGLKTPVIVITGQTLIDAENQALQRGAIGFLRKPFCERLLLDLIEQQQNEADDQ